MKGLNDTALSRRAVIGCSVCATAGAAMGAAVGGVPLAWAADAKAIHVISSGLKAGATWGRVETLQACRECCGGQGFLAANRIGPMKNDMDVDVTFEGDNTVMMQQVSRHIAGCQVLLGGVRWWRW